MEQKIIEIKLDDIIDKENPRKDLEPEALRQLANSIKEHGLLEPVSVAGPVDGKYTLILGRRRFKASKLAECETIRAIVINSSTNHPTGVMSAIQLTENIQRQDLNPVEEGEAFQEMRKVKIPVKAIAAKISKPEAYVEKRLAILAAGDDVKKALRNGDIRLGHALALARVVGGEQSKLLKQAVKQKMSVGDLVNSIGRGNSAASVFLNDAIFDRNACNGCKHNGGEQAILFETEGLKGHCLNPSCYTKKHNEVINSLKKKLDDAKVVRLENAYGNRGYSELYHAELKNFEEAVKKPEDYGYYLGKNCRGLPKLELWAKNKRQKIEGGHGSGMDNPEVRSKNVLIHRVQEYKTKFLEDKIAEKLNPGIMKTLLVVADYHLLKTTSLGHEGLKRYGITLGPCGPVNLLSKLLTMDNNDLIGLMHAINCQNVVRFDGGELEELSRFLKLDLKKEFRITEDFLQLHTIYQLKALAKELGGDVSKVSGKKAIVKAIMSGKTAGRVPKVFEKKLE